MKPLVINESLLKPSNSTESVQHANPKNSSSITGECSDDIYVQYSYLCPHCTFISAHRTSARRHINTTHASLQLDGPSKIGEKELFLCRHCDFNSNHKTSAKRHVKTIHQGIKQKNLSRKANSSSTNAPQDPIPFQGSHELKLEDQSHQINSSGCNQSQPKVSFSGPSLRIGQSGQDYKSDPIQEPIQHSNAIRPRGSQYPRQVPQKPQGSSSIATTQYIKSEPVYNPGPSPQNMSIPQNQHPAANNFQLYSPPSAVMYQNGYAEVKNENPF